VLDDSWGARVNDNPYQVPSQDGLETPAVSGGIAPRWPDLLLVLFAVFGTVGLALVVAGASALGLVGWIVIDDVWNPPAEPARGKSLNNFLLLALLVFSAVLLVVGGFFIACSIAYLKGRRELAITFLIVGGTLASMFVFALAGFVRG
jgi:hypothetical protein